MTEDIKSQEAPTYIGKGKRRNAAHENEIILQALGILETRHKPGELLGSPADSAAWLRLKLRDREYEVFGVVWLDQRHRIISHGEVFRGTVNGASVYPRELVKEGLAFNAAAVVLYHNHPAGLAEPSNADEVITRRIKDALALVDIRVLDHVVVGHEGYVSFAERGIL